MASLLGTPVFNKTPSTTSVSVNHTLVAGSNRAVVIIVHWEQNGRSVSSVTYGGVSVTLTSGEATGTFWFSQVFVLFEANLPADGVRTAVANIAGGATNYASISVVSVQDCAQSIGDSGTYVANTDTPNITLTSGTDNAFIVAGCIATNAGTSFTTTDSQAGTTIVEMYDQDMNYSVSGAYIYNVDTGNNTVTMTTTAAYNQGMAAILLEDQPPSALGSANFFNFM